eukprot:5253543-Alexandrium_andersonii.AAC.1
MNMRAPSRQCQQARHTHLKLERLLGLAVFGLGPGDTLRACMPYAQQWASSGVHASRRSGSA